MNNLISTIFNTKPPFIKVTNEGFRVNDHLQRTIQFKIHDFAFIRKLFTNARMSCIVNTQCAIYLCGQVCSNINQYIRQYT